MDKDLSLKEPIFKIPYERLAAVWDPDARFLLWGAGNNGLEFWNKFNRKLNLLGFIDQNPEKQGRMEVGSDSYAAVYSPAQAKSRFPDAKIIITATAFQEIMRILRPGIENLDFYERRTFESLYYNYTQGVLWFSFAALIVTEKCSLRCRHCIHAVPYARAVPFVSLEEHKKSCDNFFTAVDRVGRLEVMGGEAFLYPQLPELLEYIGQNYGRRIDLFSITTNGTCPLTEKLEQAILTYGIQVEVSDYRKTVPAVIRERIEHFLCRLLAAGIPYLLREQGEWIDFGYQDPALAVTDPLLLKNRYQECASICHGLYKNRVYQCTSEIGAVSAGWCRETEGDFVSLKEPDRQKLRNMLFALDLGYPPGGYLTWCGKCMGYLSPIRVPAGEQLG